MRKYAGTNAFFFGKIVVHELYVSLLRIPVFIIGCRAAEKLAGRGCAISLYFENFKSTEFHSFASEFQVLWRISILT